MAQTIVIKADQQLWRARAAKGHRKLLEGGGCVLHFAFCGFYMTVHILYTYC